MKVYVATSGEYSDYRICHVFRNKEDAEAYAEIHGDARVEEYELREAPVERRAWYTFYWAPDRPDAEHVPGSMRMGNPWEYPPESRDFYGNPRHVEHEWKRHVGDSRLLVIQGWDRDRVLKVYSEQRAQELARREGVS